MTARTANPTPLLLRLVAWTALALGLLDAIGGAWLLALGGSAYYLLAGLCLALVGWLLLRRRPAALHLMAALIVATLIWSIAEIGLDWWKLVPRGDLIVPLGLAMTLPWITRALRHRAGETRPWLTVAGPLALALVGAGGVAVASGFADHDWHGRLPGVRGAIAASDQPDGDWRAYARSWAGQKWSPLRQVTPANVARLQLAWEVHTGDRQRPGDPDEITYEVTPIKVADTVYLCTPHNRVLALDAETGKTRWAYDPQIKVTGEMQHLSCRGVSYAEVPQASTCQRRILTATNDARLIALDAATGRPCPGFGANGQISTLPGQPGHPLGWYQFTSAPLVTRGLVVLGGAIYDNKALKMPSGVIRAYDLADGHLAWNFDPGRPDATAPLAPGQHYVLSTPNSWSTSTADEALGLIYVPMGMGAVDQWGGARPATTERFATSVLALEAATGKVRWVFQTVHHDLWDMDVPAQPALVDLDLPGKGRVPALVQSTKTGLIFVLDRRTGRPLHPVTDRPVPQGAAPGDRLSPTQPFSSVSFLPPRATESGMWGATMLDQLACRIKFRRLRYDGAFTPPSTQGTLVFPGNFGVMDWGGMAIDPERQVAFAHPNYMGFVDRLVPRSDPASGNRHGPSGGSDLHGASEHGYNPNFGAPYAVELNPFLSPLGLPCQAPPWGYVAGLDLVTGKIAWRRANGTTRDQMPVPIPFKMGVPSLGGPMVTASGLGFMSSTLDYYLRAYDLATGDVLWRARLPAGAQATPMTYLSPSGRQMIVVVAGGHNSLGTRLGDSVMAYALPR
ncbi:membrane-bound PQQ-dependent dehydrogenase, glucose/quinate/shikimate family [Novosphingobium huizhouense]|uniref:membrane-bound PQQ-dependent dehydrogenase, glucose/quinate/shikimate family n=1 Tax=Novosphingobium huizhouense TaxID=2866625 RepID=UPI001CD82D3C|nr:membrane-bound PQQ-dependent dehydrogenase, glucose/quinate/shikimate family [Novosphingobium huizhouense]